MFAKEVPSRIDSSRHKSLICLVLTGKLALVGLKSRLDKTMRIVVALLCVLLTCGTAYPRDAKFTWDSARSSLESETKQQLDFMKVVLYNRSYGLAKCLVEHPNSSAGVNKCAQKFLEEFQGFYLMIANYDVVAPDKIANCFAKNRMPREERRFPPYRFLKGAHVHLYDLKKLTECIKR